MAHRRDFILSSLAATIPASAANPPIRIGHRQASMPRQAPAEVFELARRIPGLEGVELQVITKSMSLWDRATTLSFKREANRWGMHIPSVAGIWPPGASLVQ